MGFRAVTIVAPNVPDGVDPLTYFTAKPRDKAQELAQQQAQAAGLALFGGAGSLEPTSLGDELEDATGGSQASAKPPTPLTAAEKQAVQNSKTCVIPKAAPLGSKVSLSQNFDYPYLFPYAKYRAASQLLGDTEPATVEPPGRERSKVASTPAPIVRPTMQELMDDSPYTFIQRVVTQHADKGMVKIVPPPGFPTDRLPFGQDISGFKCEKQVFLSRADAESFSARAVRKGFFRAVLQFHATAHVDKGKRRMQKLPSFEKKPLDLYRLYKSVRVRGGLDMVVKRKEWAQVGRELGYASQALPTLSSTLRQAYVRAIQPFENFLEQNGVVLNPHVLPLFDVEDEDRPAKPRPGVKVLPNGIIVDLRDDNVAARDREIVVLDESRNQGPSYTLKSFRQKAATQPMADPELSIDAKEALYWSLPSHFEVEQVSARPGIQLLPFPSTLASNGPYSWVANNSRNPWKLSLLSLHDDALARHVHEDIDDFVVPRIHVGQQFATQDWHAAAMASYTITSLIEGSPRTWYTKDNVFVDQHIGEYILVFPNVRTMHWCHGYSVAKSVNLFPGFDWLDRALNTEVMNNPMDFCVQKLVYEASRSTLSADVQDQILKAIRVLRKREELLFSKLSHLRRKGPDAALDTRPITCVATGAKRYFSWVLVDGETWSPEAVLEAKPATANLVLVTRYTDVSSLFDEMVVSVHKAGSTFQRWREAVPHSIAGAALPKASELTTLSQTAPNSTENNRVSTHLLWIVELMKEWLASIHEGDHAKPLSECREAYNDLIGCVDDKGAVEAARQQASDEERTVEEFWNRLLMALKEGAVPDATIFGELESLLPRYPHVRHFIEELRGVSRWAKKVAEKVYEAPTDPTTLMVLKEEGLSLNVSASAEPMQVIEKQLKWLAGRFADIDRFMADRGAFDAAAIRYYRKTVDVNSLPADVRDRFLVLVFNLGLIDRMTGPELSQRPKRREAEVLSVFPAFAHAISELNMWLSDAQSLDWLLIIGQLQKLAAHEPIAYAGPRISTSRLLKVRDRMYGLKIVPDDIELVQKTIEDATRALEATPPASRMVYGFDP